MKSFSIIVFWGFFSSFVLTALNSGLNDLYYLATSRDISEQTRTGMTGRRLLRVSFSRQVAQGVTHAYTWTHSKNRNKLARRKSSVLDSQQCWCIISQASEKCNNHYDYNKICDSSYIYIINLDAFPNWLNHQVMTKYKYLMCYSTEQVTYFMNTLWWSFITRQRSWSELSGKRSGDRVRAKSIDQKEWNQENKQAH